MAPLTEQDLESQIREYAERYPRYVVFAKTLKDVLEAAARDVAPLAIVMSRPKAVASFAEKVWRKRAKYVDPLAEITDLTGARVITHTPTQVKAISEFIERHFEIDVENSVDHQKSLQPTEFGYRSVHYIVSFRRPWQPTFPTRDVEVRVPDEVIGLKGEIQVRTMAEHAWEDLNHDLGYKGGFELPDRWKRELHAVAATIEGVDTSFDRIDAALRKYGASGAYMDTDERRAEIARLGIVLSEIERMSELVDERERAGLASRIGRLALTSGHWDTAIDVLSRYAPADTGCEAGQLRADEPVALRYRAILRDLGVALCEKHANEPDCDVYRRGQCYLELAGRAAAADARRDVDALLARAASWERVAGREAEAEVRAGYREAFEEDPTNPYALGGYLEHEVGYARDVAPAVPLRPVIGDAIVRCREQVRVRVGIPMAFYELGKLELLRVEPYRALAAYAKGLEESSEARFVTAALDSLERLASAGDGFVGRDWGEWLLLLGLAAGFPDALDPGVRERLRRQTPTRCERGTDAIDCEPITGPLVIVVGGCEPSIEELMAGYREELVEAFRGFAGTVISGGTHEGVGGLIGDVGAAHPAIRTIGYVPDMLRASDATMDTDPSRYRELRRTPGIGFSPAEPLQNWIDFAAGSLDQPNGHFDPSSVKVLGINGGRVAAAEFRIALALGARVGVVEGSGREAASVLDDEDWRDSENLAPLPRDPQTLRAFIGSGEPSLADDVREQLAMAIHEAYCAAQRGRKRYGDPALAPWDELEDDYRGSNLSQAEHIAVKLRELGYAVAEADGSPAPLAIDPGVVEFLAEMEHGRYNVERLFAGWRRGEERSTEQKTNPAIRPWSELDDEVREYDREAVRAIPALLAGAGLEARPVEG